ncbi:MAG: 50S ribosomal protein L17 [Chloroflexi bacterium]|uniref:Large ribosomal subunit protein bL17 n=1 Tax=Candidatus Chlorohelix allophototropha TaxID=3003348 RepID=A0A8T7M1X7_9CHLR|nr:50S ribosomal protein L17 [Chloroflexota bacterium]WJW65652.1 50S ribosomal protein L17 [Chloroflexota bacterium L227-S17]
MRHGVAGRKFDRPTGQRLSMFRNLLISVIAHERIRTTEAKAKEIQPMIEHLVRISVEDNIPNRRIVTSKLSNSAAVNKLFTVIGPRYTDRRGGYTRIIKLGTRLGDNAEMVIIEFVPA